MKHYAVILDWASDGERGVSVKAITHTEEEAKIYFGEFVVDEKTIATDNNYDVIEKDTDTEFYAYEKGYESLEHTKLFIQEVK